MPRYCVRVREVHRIDYTVDADSPEDAALKVDEGGGEEGEEHSECVLDRDSWPVFEIK